MKRKMLALVCAMSAAAALQAFAEILMGAPFADGAVLQREMKVPVWGKIVSGKEAPHDSGAARGVVKVEFAGQTKTADVGKDGTWRVYLDPMEASKESRTMTVSVVAPDGSSDLKGESVEVRDVLVGEVWLASGQSNMECPIWGSCARYRDMKGGFMTAMTRLPNVRYVKCERKWSAEPVELSATWRKFTPEGLLHFNQIATHVGGGDSEEIALSAVAFYYARELYLALDVPIGIVDVSWGGSNIDAWIPKCGYDGCPASIQKQQTPGMYNGMVAAFAPMAVRGMIWYQGCTNWFKKEGDVYCDKLHALYNGWSREFANKDLKIYLAQLAPWEQNWMEICIAQTKFCAEEKNAALAVLADVGNFRDIHPNDKEIVAKRLVLHALKRDYGFDIPEDDSPVLKSVSFDGGKARLAFDHVKDWYVYAPDHSRAPAFELAGEDGVWHPATILNYRKRKNSEGKETGTDFIDGPEIVLSSAEVSNPVKVRYMGKPLTSGTLYNEASLPLGPFESTSECNPAAAALAADLPPLPKAKCPDPATLEINAGRAIKFENPLPRMRCGNVKCGTYNNMELSLPGVLTTSDARLGMFLQKMRETVMANRRLLFLDGKVIVCNHNWIRDHVHQMKGWKHWEYDPLSFLQFIIDTQRADGQFFELVKQLDDYHWTYVGPESSRLYPEDNVALVRLELEADIEYLVVEGAWQYYRMTGDDKWLASVLASLEKGIDYQTSDPMRWEESLGLCIRPYTIDTWDFTNDPASGGDRRVAGKPLCAMHGDNTGVYQAMRQLAWMNRRLGDEAKAAKWDARAEALKAGIMKHLWNGRFFVHQLPVRGAKPIDGNEAGRLSLSDAYALNRGILSGDECRAVIDAFIERGKTAGTFSEFFTIDPAYEPSFNRYKPGEYVNGAISPFTAGELAKGAFRNGREKYGWDVISRWIDKVEKDKALYFLYNRTTGESISEEAGPSAWGAAAFLDAIEEGLAGIVDAGTGFDVIEFSPRWCVTSYTELRYVTGYELTKKYVDVRYVQTDAGMRYHLRSPAKKVVAHILLPEGRTPRALFVNGEEAQFKITTVGESRYVDTTVAPKDGVADFELPF